MGRPTISLNNVDSKNHFIFPSLGLVIERGKTSYRIICEKQGLKIIKYGRVRRERISVFPEAGNSILIS